MAGERQLPGLGLYGYWTSGSNGWGTQHSDGIRAVSALLQGKAISRTTVLPGSPTNGDIYIVRSDDGTNPNKIALRDNGAWVYLTPVEGWRIYVADEKGFVRYDGSAWASEDVSVREFTGTTDTAVLADANNIILANNASAMTGTIPPNSSVAFKVGTVLTYINKGAGVLTLAQGAGVTIHPAPAFTLVSAGQWAVLSVLKIGTDEWVLTGQTVAA